MSQSTVNSRHCTTGSVKQQKRKAVSRNVLFVLPFPARRINLFPWLYIVYLSEFCTAQPGILSHWMSGKGTTLNEKSPSPCPKNGHVKGFPCPKAGQPNCVTTLLMGLFHFPIKDEFVFAWLSGDFSAVNFSDETGLNQLIYGFHSSRSAESVIGHS